MKDEIIVVGAIALLLLGTGCTPTRRLLDGPETARAKDERWKEIAGASPKLKPLPPMKARPDGERVQATSKSVAPELLSVPAPSSFVSAPMASVSAPTRLPIAPDPNNPANATLPGGPFPR